MDSDTLIVIIVPQEFERANHRFLWEWMAKQANCEVLILDIPSDMVFTALKGKNYRKSQSMKGARKISEGLSILRPHYFIRPEVIPICFKNAIKHKLFKNVRLCYDRTFNKYKFLVYSSKWVKVLFDGKHDFYYYIIDEIRKRDRYSYLERIDAKYDDFACKHSKHIFTMTQDIIHNREEYSPKSSVIGNGSNYTNSSSPNEPYQNSVAFVGKIRDWIDFKLLEELIQKRADLTFYFLGPIQDEVNNTFQLLINKYENIKYLGSVEKDKIDYYYKMFQVIIVPYKNTPFIQATRPIKIVEAVFAGVPVVSIPINGFEEQSFIKFANSVDSFSTRIDELISAPIDLSSNEYKSFITFNSWEYKAKQIIEIMN